MTSAAIPLFQIIATPAFVRQAPFANLFGILPETTAPAVSAVFDADEGRRHRLLQNFAPDKHHHTTNADARKHANR